MWFLRHSLPRHFSATLLPQPRSGKAPFRQQRIHLGIWANYDFDISEEDLAEARREMWGNFPRDVER